MYNITQSLVVRRIGTYLHAIHVRKIATETETYVVYVPIYIV